MALGQGLLDGRLPRQQPIHGLIEFILIGRIHLEDLAQSAVQGFRVESASGGEFGGGVEKAGHDHGQDEIPLAARALVNQGVELELAQRAENGGNMAVGAGASDFESIGPRGGGRSTLQDLAQSLDAIRRPVRKVGESAILDLAVEAKRLPEEDGRRGLAVRDGRYVHAYIMGPIVSQCKQIHYEPIDRSHHLHDYARRPTIRHHLQFKPFCGNNGRNFGLASIALTFRSNPTAL